MKIYIVSGYCPFNYTDVVCVFKNYSDALAEYNRRKNEIIRLNTYYKIKESENDGDFIFCSERVWGDKEFIKLRESKLI